jgi:hypothetical protein
MVFALRCVADEEHVMLQEQMPDRHTMAYLERQARSLRIESNRASPTLARQFLALAEIYEARLAQVAPSGAALPA